MGQPVIGDVVVVQFPFSNLKGGKLRPALVLATAEFDNFVLCQITSKSYASQTAIHLESGDFSRGSLPITSYIRPDKLFTCDPAIIEYVAGRLTDKKFDKVLTAVRSLFAR